MERCIFLDGWNQACKDCATHDLGGLGADLTEMISGFFRHPAGEGGGILSILMVFEFVEYLGWRICRIWIRIRSTWEAWESHWAGKPRSCWPNDERQLSCKATGVSPNIASNYGKNMDTKKAIALEEMNPLLHFIECFFIWVLWSLPGKRRVMCKFSLHRALTRQWEHGNCQAKNWQAHPRREETWINMKGFALDFKKRARCLSTFSDSSQRVLSLLQVLGWSHAFLRIACCCKFFLARNMTSSAQVSHHFSTNDQKTRLTDYEWKVHWATKEQSSFLGFIPVWVEHDRLRPLDFRYNLAMLRSLPSTFGRGVLSRFGQSQQPGVDLLG